MEHKPAKDVRGHHLIWCSRNGHNEYGLYWSTECKICRQPLPKDLIRLRDFMNKMDGHWPTILKMKGE